MADLQPYRFEPECVPNPEDSESENEEVNDRLESTFWCTCERCEIMPAQRECVCCREQPEEENKIEGRILSLYCIGCSKWKKQFSLLIDLDIKRQFNIVISSYFFASTVCIFILLCGGATKGFLVSLQTRIFNGLKRIASCFSLLFPDLRTQHFVSVTDFVTILHEVFITNVDILKCFVIKRAVPTKLKQPQVAQARDEGNNLCK